MVLWPMCTTLARGELKLRCSKPIIILATLNHVWLLFFFQVCFCHLQQEGGGYPGHPGMNTYIVGCISWSWYTWWPLKCTVVIGPLNACHGAFLVPFLGQLRSLRKFPGPWAERADTVMVHPQVSWDFWLGQSKVMQEDFWKVQLNRG